MILLYIGAFWLIVNVGAVVFAWRQSEKWRDGVDGK